MVRDRSHMWDYQEHAVRHILDNTGACLFMQMGLGKTCATLTALDVLLYDTMEISKPLIIAPKRVAESTWDDEIASWSHLRHLTVSHVLGTEKQRNAALKAKADIYIINRENVPWLVSQYQSKFPFDMIIIDELTSFKNPDSRRFRALKLVRPLVKRVVGLTGTPTPNGIPDLWAQMYLIDRGERLGKTLGDFRRTYLKEGKRNRSVIFNYEVKDEATSQSVLDTISDVCISMKTTDYLDLPARIDRDVWITLSPDMQKKYDDFERDLVMQIDDVNDVSAVNAAALLTKLRQFANGAIYDENRDWHELHQEKLEAIAESLESANGSPVLIFYQFKHDLERLQQFFRKLSPVTFSGPNDQKKWNLGQIKLMFTHAASAGHGVNLQYGGHHCFWYGLDYNLEYYEQGCCRLDRQGQKYPVINSRFLVRGTVDERVLTSIEGKQDAQSAVMDSLKAIMKRHKTMVNK